LPAAAFVERFRAPGLGPGPHTILSW